jgi:crotonobetainyl-CoA:carnitine CoA-transferase CaiB-like acyl-CoA transferase
MAEQKNTGAALDDLRVLDLADEKGVYCGKVLAGLGAEVIKIEKPGGDAMRDNGPFYHDIPHRERSLYWWHFNTNKKSITLNIETTDGRELFEKLVQRVDVVIESFEPG